MSSLRSSSCAGPSWRRSTTQETPVKPEYRLGAWGEEDRESIALSSRCSATSP